jgi:hypothetical protein
VLLLFAVVLKEFLHPPTVAVTGVAAAQTGIRRAEYGVRKKEDVGRAATRAAARRAAIDDIVDRGGGLREERANSRWWSEVLDLRCKWQLELAPVRLAGLTGAFREAARVYWGTHCVVLRKDVRSPLRAY